MPKHNQQFLVLHQSLIWKKNPKLRNIITILETGKDGKGNVNVFLERINDFSQSRNIMKKKLIHFIGELLLDYDLI